MIRQKRIPQHLRQWLSSRCLLGWFLWWWFVRFSRRFVRFAGGRAALATAFQPLLCQFRQGLVGLAGQNLFVKTSRLIGIVAAVQLDVAQQQRHKGAPPEHRSLSLLILRLVHQLLQQPTGQPMGFGVVALAVSPFGVLVCRWKSPSTLWELLLQLYRLLAVEG